MAKWKAFHKDYVCEGLEYKLLFEDGTEARFLPGQTLSRYKEELGCDYRRITLFFCTEEDFDGSYRCTFDSSSHGEEWYRTSISGGKEKKRKTDYPEVNGVTPPVSLVQELKEPCSESVVECVSLKDTDIDVDMVSHNLVGSIDNTLSDPLCEESASCMAPEDFLWEDVAVIDEDELFKAAIARGIQDQKSTAEEIELQHLIEAF